MKTICKRSIVSRTGRLLGFLALCAACASCGIGATSFAQETKIEGGQNSQVKTELKNIIEVVAETDQLKTLTAALKLVQLSETLSGERPFTLLAPSDYAFSKLPPETMQHLMKPEGRAQLQSILKYHVLSGKANATDVIAMTKAKTVHGAEIMIDSDSTGIRINQARVGLTNIGASNGVTHMIDIVLMPPQETPRQTTTTNSVVPTVANESQDLGSNRRDSIQENKPDPVEDKWTANVDFADKNIVQAAGAIGEFSKFLAAIKVAGLEEALQGDGPYTVFAPTDDAINALPEGTHENLLKDENRKQLQNLLMNHVLKGNFSSADMAAVDNAGAASGVELKIKAPTDGSMMVNNANIIESDVKCSNGTIHAIDQLLLTE